MTVFASDVQFVFGFYDRCAAVFPRRWWDYNEVADAVGLAHEETPATIEGLVVRGLVRNPFLRTLQGTPTGMRWYKRERNKNVGGPMVTYSSSRVIGVTAIAYARVSPDAREEG